MERTNPLTRRHWAITCLFLFAGSMVLIVPAALMVMSTMSNEVLQWIPKGLPEADEYDEFLEHFPSDELAVVSWEGCTLNDPCLEAVAEQLRQAKDNQGEPLFQSVLTGTELFELLTSEPLNLAPTAAKARLLGNVLGPDGTTTCCLVWLAEPDRDSRHAAVDAIYQAAQKECELSESQVYLGGPIVDAVAVDIEAEKSLYQLAGLSSVCAVLLSAICLRSLLYVGLVFVVALYSEIAAVAVVLLGDTQMNSVLIMMPTLVYVVGISSGVHFVNYFHESQANSSQQAAISTAIGHAWRPCLLSSVTTAIGLGSLAISDVIPVRDFGIYSSLGVLISFGVLFTLGVAYLTVTVPVAPAWVLPAQQTRRWKWLRVPVRTALRNYQVVLVVVVLLCPLAITGLSYLRTSVKVQNLFASETRIMRDYRWLEANVVPLVPFEVVLKIPTSAEIEPADRVQLVTQVQEAIQELEPVRGTLSAATFLPPQPQGSSTRALFRRKFWKRTVDNYYPTFQEFGLLRIVETDRHQLWRISGRIPGLNDIDYGQYMQTLRGQVEPVLEASEFGDMVSVQYTGAIPTIYAAQRELLNDLIESFLLAFGLILLLLVFVQKGITSGLLALIPNVLPSVLVFGTMGWLGWPIDIGTMMTASIGLGVAVDDTLHYLHAFQRSVSLGYSKASAIYHAAQKCSAAMIQTSLICGLGLLPFTLSQFLPTARFAWLVLALLLVALACDLLVLPALLISPLGKVFLRAPLLQSKR